MNVSYVSPEDFQHFKIIDSGQSCKQKSSKQSDSSMMYLIVAVIVAFVVVMTISSIPKCTEKIQQIPDMISTMATKVASVASKYSRNNTISSKQSTTTQKLDKYVKFVHEKCKNLTECIEGDGECHDFKNVAANFKKSTTEKVHEYLDTHPNMLILVYAPWCPHCHTALPEFMKVVDEVKDTVDVAILNAEMVERELLGTMNITHFPYIAKCKDGMKSGTHEVYRGAPKSEELIKFCKGTNNVAVNAKKVVNELDMLFM